VQKVYSKNSGNETSNAEMEMRTADESSSPDFADEKKKEVNTKTVG
jgi:hypothetical protein